jgi:hypothetical protein
MKKIMVVSDLHGEIGLEHLRTAYIREGGADILFCCGDLETSEHDVWQAARGAQCFMVCGNCDFFTQLPNELEMRVEDVRFWMVHGDRYGVRQTTAALFEEGNRRGANVALFGHTHIPLLEDCSAGSGEKESLRYIINPGSLGRPYQKSGRPAYSVMEVNGSEISVQMKEM